MRDDMLCVKHKLENLTDVIPEFMEVNILI